MKKLNLQAVPFILFALMMASLSSYALLLVKDGGKVNIQLGPDNGIFIHVPSRVHPPNNSPDDDLSPSSLNFLQILAITLS